MTKYRSWSAVIAVFCALALAGCFFGAGATCTSGLRNAANGATIVNGQTVPVGTRVYVQALVTSPATSLSGTVLYTIWEDSATCGGPIHIAQTVSVNSNGTVANSKFTGPLVAETYSASAYYSGDSRHKSSTSTCEHFIVK